MNDDNNVYGSGLNSADWCALRDVIFPFLHVDDPSTVAIRLVPSHLKNHKILKAIRKYKKSKNNKYLDEAGQGLIPSKEPFGWYVALTK